MKINLMLKNHYHIVEILDWQAFSHKIPNTYTLTDINEDGDSITLIALYVKK